MEFIWRVFSWQLFPGPGDGNFVLACNGLCGGGGVVEFRGCVFS